MTTSVSDKHYSTISSGNSQTTPRRRIIQDYLLIWIDTNIVQDKEHVLAQLRTIINDINVFADLDEAIDFISDLEDTKVLLVVDHTLGQPCISLIHSIPQINEIYILCHNQIRNQHWEKVKNVHDNIEELCQVLEPIVKQYNQDSNVPSFGPPNETTFTGNINQLESTFMYTQIFKEILLEMGHDGQAVKKFSEFCRANDCAMPNIIDQFEKEYSQESTLFWYTSHSFLYSLLNHALRTMQADIIIMMGFFICDLHRQLEYLHRQQIKTDLKDVSLVYRGQGLSREHFDKFLKTKGGLMSFNNFLSTSEQRSVSQLFAESVIQNINLIGILFIISIDPSISSTPYASIGDFSQFSSEVEVLFSMHTVFRIGAVKSMDDNQGRLYEIELQLTADDDEQLRILTKQMSEEAAGDTGWQRLGNLLLAIGQCGKAEALYNILLEKTSNVCEKATFYHQLGYIKNDQGDYDKAMEYYKKSLEINEKLLPSNHAKLATSYNSLGVVHMNMGEYSKALSFCVKALQIKENTLSKNHPYMAATYNNIAAISYQIGKYETALVFFEKALEMFISTLPGNHPDLSITYNNIGRVHMNMGEYSKALVFYEKALEMKENVLPPNHPDLACPYDDIGKVYTNMGEYSKALSFCEKALKIKQTTIASIHSDLITSYNNIGTIYENMNEYLKAFSFYEKAVEISRQTLPVNHPDLATSYNNIGALCLNMREYQKALSFHQQALDIRQKIFLNKHPVLAESFNNIGLVYMNLEAYFEALSFLKRALEIREDTLHKNHPDLAILYNNIGSVYNSIGKYSTALTFFEKSLHIEGKVFAPNHPQLATTYNNIAVLYYNMREYSKSLVCFQRVLDIEQHTLPENHSQLKSLKDIIKILKDKLQGTSTD